MKREESRKRGLVNYFALAKRPLETVGSRQRLGGSRLKVVAGVLAFLALPLHAQNSGGARSVDGIYRGTIGNQEIVVELRGPLDGEHGENYADAGDDKTYPIQGSYFYRRHGVSIKLVGTPLGNGVVRLREYRHVVRDDEFTAEWRLTMQEGKAKGTFCKCDLSHPPASAAPPQPGQQLQISLTRVSQHLTPDSGPEDYKPNSGDTYNDLLLDFPLQEGPEIQVSPEIAYRMRTDSRFKVSRPRLTRFPNAAVMERINRDLNADLTQSRLRAAEVLSGGEFGGRFGGIYDEKTTVNFFLPHVLSFVVETQWFSGGAHPNEGGYSIDYDLHTGKRVDLEEAFRTSPENEAESGAILAKLYLRHYVKPPREEAPPDIDCEEIVRQRISEKDEPFRPILYLSRKGLVIEPPLPHMVQDCGPPVTVAYSELRPYVQRGSILRFLVDARTAHK
jgi:hypothetical protein